MLVAVKGQSFPQIGKVTYIPDSPTLESSLQVQWLQQEKATHKPKWLRFFKSSSALGNILFSDIVLYDFDLTRHGALKKKARDYLKNLSY